MREIKLSQNKVALVDDEDFERLNQFKWCALKGKYGYYAARQSIKIKGKQTTIRMHRVIMNAPKGFPVDHRNGNGLDNQKENLRNCTCQQNKCNQRNPYKNNKLKIKGCGWSERHKKFSARIQVNGKAIYLGGFSVLGDADSAYRTAEKKYFGEFARTI